MKTHLLLLLLILLCSLSISAEEKDERVTDVFSVYNLELDEILNNRQKKKIKIIAFTKSSMKEIKKTQRLNSKGKLYKRTLNSQQSGAMGADSSGGGSYRILNDGNIALLDYSIYFENFQDRYQLSQESQISLGQHANLLGFHKVSFEFFKQLGIYKLLQSRLNAWRSNSPILIKAIESSLEAIDWKLTPYDVLSFYENDDIIGGVFYDNKKGAWLSTPAWNRSGDFSMAGMLVHEALRHFNMKLESNISESDIHFLTTKIMLTNPKGDEILGKGEYFKNNSYFSELFGNFEKSNDYQRKIREEFLNLFENSGEKNLENFKRLLDSYKETQSNIELALTVVDITNEFLRQDNASMYQLRKEWEQLIDKYYRSILNLENWNLPNLENSKLGKALNSFQIYKDLLLDSEILITP